MASANLVLKMVDEEKERFPDKDVSRIYIGGFSQGCMVSLAAFLMHKGPKPLGGVVGLSGMQALDLKLIAKTHSQEELESVRRATPMFLYHGRADQTLPCAAAEKTYDWLKSELYEGVKSDIFTYQSEKNLAHSLSPKEIRDIS